LLAELNSNITPESGITAANKYEEKSDRQRLLAEIKDFNFKKLILIQRSSNKIIVDATINNTWNKVYI
jgi:hypothetical protein